MQDVDKTTADVIAALLAENDALRAEIAKANELLGFIAQIIPVADDTCEEPGIDFVEACRREIAGRKRCGPGQ